MEIGDVYSVEIPPSDGHEQAGSRPAVVVQDIEFSNRLSTVLIVPLTSNQAARAFPGTFVVQPDAVNGLRRSSVVLAFQLRAIDKRRLGQRLGRLADAHIEELQGHIRALMRLSK
jgi:mRNA interferase MazF